MIPQPQNTLITKKLIILAVIMMASICAFCVPAKRVWRTVTLNDGTTTEAMMVGDEHGHWFVDHSGKALRMNAAGRMDYLSAEQLNTIKTVRQTRLTKANALRMERIKTTRALSVSATSSSSSKRNVFGKPTTILGQHRGLVILANFSNKSFKTANNQALFERRFNEEGYTNSSGYVGSVHDYFYDQSYGKFDLTFDVVGPVTLSHTHDYYGANDTIQGVSNDRHAAAMVIEAIQLADAQGVDFSKYDWDGDGEVDQVFVIYAGTGEASSYVENDIWPHEYELAAAKQDGDGSGAQWIDGVWINTYACSCELASSTTIDGIGTACHEFSHCLGYADLYDTDYSGGQGMMYWDLLDGGSYNGPKSNGEVPPAFTSFERWWAGWMDLTVLDHPQFVTEMPALNDTAVAYKIVNDAYPNEYYLLENRQAKKWDLYTAGNGDGTGHGMLILHVDYDETAWTQNAPNDDKNHQRMTFFPADNSYGTYYDDYGQWGETYAQCAGDPFPGTSNNTSFTDTSKPAATLYNSNSDGRKFMGKPITDITESDGLISFTFDGGVNAPSSTSECDITADSFTASWTPVEYADSYSLIAYPYTAPTLSESCLLREDFSNFKTTTGSDSNVDKSGSLDNYTSVNGWTGYKVYVGGNGYAKIGSSKATGYIITPSVHSTTGKLTLYAELKCYNNDNNYGVAWLIQPKTSNQISGQQKELSLGDNFKANVVTFNYSNACSVMIMPDQRGYLKNLRIYDGEFSLSDIQASDSTSSAKTKALYTMEETRSNDTIYVTGITDTCYTITGLQPRQYCYRLMTVSGNQQSEWGEQHIIDLSAYSGIVNIIADDRKLTHRQGIYTLSGTFIGTTSSNLPKGIYIINGKKQIIK